MTIRLELHIEAGVVGRAPRAPDGRWTEEVRYQNSAELIAAVAQQSRGNGRPTQVLVVLEPAVIQRRDLRDLPPVPARELDRLVARGAVRFFRQNGHPLVTAVVESAGAGPAGQAVRAIAVDSSVTDAILAGTRESGALLADIHAAEVGSAVSLLPAGERSRRSRQGWLSVLRMAGGVALLWLLTGAGLYGWIGWQTRGAESALRRLEEPRRALVAARRSMDSASAMVESVAVLDRDRAALATRLNAVIAALPDSALLTRLDLDLSGGGALEGRAATAHQVGERLRAVGSLHDPRLTESGNRESAGGVAWERFSIRMGEDSTP